MGYGPTATEMIVAEFEQKERDGRLMPGDTVIVALARELAFKRSEIRRLSDRLDRYVLDLIGERKKIEEMKRAAIEWCPNCTPKVNP